MTKLTQTQRIILTAAAEREDGSIMPMPSHVKGGAATKVIHALLNAGMISEMPFTITSTGREALQPSVPAALEKLTVDQIATAISAISGEVVPAKFFNYKHKALDRLALLIGESDLSVRDVLLAAGIEAIAPDGTAFSGFGLAPDSAPQEADDRAIPETATTVPAVPSKSPDAPASAPQRKARADSKQAQLIEMLKRPKGVTIEEITAAFGWQAHTVRGAFAGALKKKLGLTVTSEKIEGRGRVYRLSTAPSGLPA